MSKLYWLLPPLPSQHLGTTLPHRRAPAPSDILWENTACTGAAAAGRRALSLAATALIIGAGVLIQYGLCLAAERERARRMAFAHHEGGPAGVDLSSLGAFLLSTRLRVVALVSAASVVVINWLVTLAVRALARFERWHTGTARERATLVKLTAAYLLSAFAAPLLAAALSGHSDSWYSQGGAVESAFWTQVANGLVWPALALADPGDLLAAQVLSRAARTQAMADALLAPPPFQLAEQFACGLTSLGLAVWWLPVLPLSPMIAAAGLFLQFLADKWVALRRARSPGDICGRGVAVVINRLLLLLPLVQLLLCRYLYFKVGGRGRGWHTSGGS